MARVEVWFPGFVQRLFDVVPRPDWPEYGSGYWDAWSAAFRGHGVAEDVARESLMRLAQAPTPYLDRQLAEFMGHVRAIWATSEVSAGGDDREAALLASKGCPDCGGQGLTVRYRHRPEPGKPATLTLYCLCPYGRWVERRHREHSADVRRRIHDLADHPFLQMAPVAGSDAWDNPFRHPPAPTPDADPPRRPGPSSRPTTARDRIREASSVPIGPDVVLVGGKPRALPPWSPEPVPGEPPAF